MNIDVMMELKQRWPKGLENAKTNVFSFLNFRLKKQIPNNTARRVIIEQFIDKES